MCQNCYINSYNKKKRLAKDDGADKIDADLDLKVEESPIPMNIEPASNSNWVDWLIFQSLNWKILNVYMQILIDNFLDFELMSTY